MFEQFSGTFLGPVLQFLSTVPQTHHIYGIEYRIYKY